MDFDFLSVTELSGDKVTQEQIDRLCHRYYWAKEYCLNKDVLEVACGTGQGSGLLNIISNSYKAGDYSSKIIDIAISHYRDRINFKRFDAQQIPFAERSLDVVILFEAIYYIPNVELFIAECRRILRPGGVVLIATANKDLSDFNPSPHSYSYYGVKELSSLFTSNGFKIQCFGHIPVNDLNIRQKILRPIKRLLVNLGLMPKTMAGKKILKRIVFGKLIKMPAEITDNMIIFLPPTLLSEEEPDMRHKVIYCAATMID